jgi:TonB family protein
MTNPLGLTKGGSMWFVRCGLAFVAIVSLAHAQSTWDPDAKPAATPQLIQSAFQRGLNPALSKAAGKVDHASCLLGVWYNAKGTILAEQIIKSSGHPEIDQACLATAIGQPLTVPVLLDPGTGGWTQLPIVWNFGKRTADNKAQPIEADPAIPALRQGDAMHVAAPYYPEAAVAARAHGICKLHVTVSEAGDVDALEITQSTGSVDLDQACLDAIYDAPFIPARREGKFVSGSTDVVLDWRLPEVATPPNQLAR